MSDYDDRRAMARAEADWLREPESDDPDEEPDPDAHAADLRARHLPADPRALTAEHVRAERLRADRLRYHHRDEEAAQRVERTVDRFVLRALALRGEGLALAATEDL